MIKTIKHWIISNKLFLFTAFAVFVLVLLYYIHIFSKNTPTDLQLHADMAMKMRQGDFFIGNFLFFFLVIIFSGGAVVFKSALIAAIGLVTFAVAFKYFLSQKLIAAAVGDSVPSGKVLRLSAFIAFALILCSVINIPGMSFTKYFIIGQFPPNGWHNSTSIFVMPFAILLFMDSFRLYEDRLPAGESWKLYFWVLMNALIKPSFLFCFLAVFPLMLLFRHGVSSAFFRKLPIVFFAFFCIVAQYILIFYMQDYFQVSEDSGIKFDPFNVWDAMSENKLISLLVSVAYPLAFAATYLRDLKKDRLYIYSFMLFVVALLIFIVLSETGSREFHGNFIWQVIICNYIWFLITMISHLKILLLRKALMWYDYIVLAVFTSHFIAGLLYLYKFSALRDFH